MTVLWKRPAKEACGILCGAERSQEWLLPWWWSRYTDHNHFPVTFCDFGMTEGMRQWCKERGEVVVMDSDSSFIALRHTIDEKLAKQWEEDFGPRVWEARPTWFKKPLALLKSPYDIGVWIDVDCEILGSLNPLLSAFDPKRELAIARDYDCDHLPRLSPHIRYNGGVVVFKHGSTIIKHWAECALTENHRFYGDDLLLSHLIYAHGLEVQELPEIYNWRIARGLNLEAVILHWVGSGGKKYIHTYGGLKPALDSFYI